MADDALQAPLVTGRRAMLVSQTRAAFGEVSRWKIGVIVGTAAAAVGTYLLLPAGVDEMQRRMLAIFIVAVVFWASEVLPLYATSLMIVGMLVVFLAGEGGMANVLPAVAERPDTTIAYSDFLGKFGSNVIILFMGGFLLSAALTKHGIDRAIAGKILAPFGKSPLALLLAVLGITAFFSMWMSNTATATMMLAIIAPIIRSLPHDDKFHRGVILAVPFGANIGGIGTPIGTPPNAIALDLINASPGMPTITFLQWMMLAVPLASVMLVACGFLLYATHKPEPGLALEPIEAPRQVSGKGWATVVILLATVALWLTSDFHGIKTGGVALLAAASLTAMGVLEKSDVDRIDWNILMLMWGGLALGTGIEASGLTDLVAQIKFESMPGGATGVAVVCVFFSLFLATVMSHTAAANLLVPVALALSVGTNENRAQLAVLVALATSFAMAMPVSTPPNAVAFATGEIKAKTMVVLGGFISIAAVTLMLLGHRLVLPWVLH